MSSSAGVRTSERSESVFSPSYHDGPDPEMSVVVPTFERSAYWHELIPVLEKQTVDTGRFEVVVIDDCSTDGTWEVLTELASLTALRLVCLRQPLNAGSGAARTVGLEHSRGAVVAFTDDDCLPTPAWLENLCAPLLAEGSRRPPALVVQGRTLPRPGESSAAGPWARGLWVRGPTWLFETCNIAYARRDLQAVGGFPSRGETPPSPSGRQVGEDALAGWEVIERGARLVFQPEALVHHRLEPASYPQWLADLRGRAVFPALAVRSPLAQRAFWGRWFLSPRSAAALLGVVAGASWAATGRGRLAWGFAPWLALALPDACNRRGRHPAVRLAQLALGDLVSLSVTSAASWRHRTLVL